MFSDLLENLFSNDEQIIASTGQLIAQFRDENPDQYIQELINIINEKSNEQNSIQPKIQQASIVLLRQVIASTTDIEKFTSSFFEQIMTLLLPKMNSENYNLAHSSAILFGESLSFLVRDKNHSDAFSQLIETLNSEISTVSLNTENNTEHKNLKFLLISIKSFAESTDLETDQIIPLFQALYQLYQTNYLTNEVLQAITAMIEEIADTFNQFSQLLSSQNSENNECKIFIGQLFSFFSQLLEKASINEANKAVIYDFFRQFFKNVSYSFFHENINKVLELIMPDISTSTNESVLLSSIHFLKTTLRREWKMKNRSRVQFSPFYNFSHFDSFLMPLIRVFAMIPDNDTNLDSDYIEYQNPHIAAQEMISIFVYTFPEHSSKLLLPLIQCLSPENCNLEESITTTFSCYDAQFEMNSFIAIETSLFLLCLITQFSTNLPSYDFIISFIGTTLSSSSVRIRFASIRALDSYFNHCFGKNQSNDETEKEDDDSKELFDIRTKLALLVPELLKHVLDEHPIISCYSMRLIAKYSSFPSKYNAFQSEIVFPLFLKVIEGHSDLNVIDDAFKYLEKMIKNRKMEEVFNLLEPVIQLLGDSNQQESNSDYNESLRALVVVILQEVTVAALPYYDVIYSLLIDHIEPHLLNYLSILSILFDHDFPHNFQQTFEIIFEFLSNSETVTEDRPLRNKIVSECCFSLLIIAKSDLFTEDVEKTSSLLLSLLSKDNSNLNTLIGISAICLYQGEKIKETLPTFYQIVSQINIIELSENLSNEESNEIDENINFDDIVSSCVNILMACYKFEKNNQEIIKLIVISLQSIISIGPKIPTLLEMAFDLILYLDNSLLLEIEDIATELIKVSAEFDYLKNCIDELREKIKICYYGSNSHFEYEEDEEEEEKE